MSVLDAPARLRLLVAVQAPDALRRRGLAGMVADAGHDLVDPADAEVLLADLDGDEPPAGLAPVLALTDRPGREEGLAGVLPRAASTTQLDAALRAVAAGLLVRAPGPIEGGFGAAPALDNEARPLLTPREVEILAAVGDGLANKAVARRLGISPHTVKFHLEAVYAKLDAASRAEAVAKGLRRGLIEV